MSATFLVFGQEEKVEEPKEMELKEISVIANRAKARETPVAFSNVSKSDLSNRLASRDLPNDIERDSQRLCFNVGWRVRRQPSQRAWI